MPSITVQTCLEQALSHLGLTREGQAISDADLRVALDYFNGRLKALNQQNLSVSSDR